MSSQFSLDKAKKAYTAGIAGAVAAAGGLTLTGFFADGKLDTNAVVTAALTVVGAFVLSFLGAWLPSNGTKQKKLTHAGVLPEVQALLDEQPDVVDDSPSHLAT